MKKLVLTLVVILVSTNSLFAAKFKWSNGKISIDDTTKFYLDKGSVKKIDNHVYYWSLGDYLKLENGDNPDVKSVITHHRVDCTDLGYQILIFSGFTDNMGKGKITFHSAQNPDLEKRYNSKNSVAYETHKELCD